MSKGLEVGNRTVISKDGVGRYESCSKCIKLQLHKMNTLHISAVQHNAYS